MLTISHDLPRSRTRAGCQIRQLGYQHVRALNISKIDVFSLTSKHLVYLLGGYPGGEEMGSGVRQRALGEWARIVGALSFPGARGRGSHQVGEVFTRQVLGAVPSQRPPIENA